MIKVFIFIIFFSTSCKKQNWKTSISKDVEDSQRVISNVLKEMRSNLEKNWSSPLLNPIDSRFVRNSIGVFTNIDKTTDSNIYVSTTTKVDKNLKNYIRRTDYLSKTWKKYYAKNQYVTWLYTFHAKSTVLRLFPWTDLSKSFGTTTEWTMLNYLKNNKDLSKIGNNFCTYPYNDVVGLGLTVSCCEIVSPLKIYDDTILACSDYSLITLLKKIRKTAIESGLIFSKIAIQSSGVEFHYKNNHIVDFENNSVISVKESKFGEELFSLDFLKIKIFKVN